MHHGKKGLLERVCDGGCGVQHLLKTPVNHLRPFERHENGVANAHRNAAQAPAGAGVGQQVVGQQGVQVQYV